jgi:hypothetical protein
MVVSFTSEFDRCFKITVGVLMRCGSNNNCTGNSVYIEKNNSNILGPGPVNLVDVGFDKVASSFQCF